MDLSREHGINQVGRGSWLSLVAETAGVSGATIARVELHANLAITAPLRAVIQVRDADGHVVGATYWHGDSTDLARGVAVDLGCDLHSTWGARVVAWLDGDSICAPRQAIAPEYVSEKSFDPFSAMKLMLRATPRLDDHVKPSAEAA